MIVYFRKGEQSPVSDHFSSHEFDCRCKRSQCKITLVSRTLVIDGLEVFRKILGVPVIITRGFSCFEHNAEVEQGALGHALKDGKHPLGIAVDVKTILDVPQMMKAAEMIPCFTNGGVGRYDDHVHLDVRGRRARW